MFRIIALDFRDLFEIVGNRPVADVLDIVEAHHTRGAEVDGAIAREHVDDGLADGFPDRATPAFIEGLGNLPVGVGWRARGKPKGVWATDAREGGSKISHYDAPFCFSHAKACARQALSLRTVLAEHTLQGVKIIDHSTSCEFLSPPKHLLL